jgi:uncharacterized protein (TIGR02996 family)
MPTSTEDAFLADIREHPDDDVPRLVFADWLEDHGDEPDRADLIRVQCRLARLLTEGAAADDLARRDQQLTERLTRSWLAPLWRLVDTFELRRGFVARVVVQAPQLIEQGEVIVRLAPVAELAVVFRQQHLEDLVTCPHLAHVARLEARDGGVGDAGAALLGRCPYLGRLEALLLHRCGISEHGLVDLLRLDLSALKVLNLGANPLGDAGLERLCDTPALAGLERLSLGVSELHLPAARALVGSRYLHRLVDLSLGANYLEDEAVEWLAAAAHLASLWRLDLRNNEFRAAGARALVRSRHLERLRFLDVSGNRLGDAARAALHERFGERVQF